MSTRPSLALIAQAVLLLVRGQTDTPHKVTDASIEIMSREMRNVVLAKVRATLSRHRAAVS